MSINGDYASLAEAVGEAPPRGGITGDEMAEIYYDCGGDDEMAYHMVSAIDDMQTRDRRAWYDEHAPDPLETISDDELLEEARERGLI